MADGTAVPSTPDSSPAPSPTASSAARPAAFRVAAPELQAVGGPGRDEQKPCRPADVVASARTQVAADSLVGVVSMSGTSCSLYIYRGPTSLLDAAGRPLAAPVRPDWATVNPPTNARPDLALGDGHADWGFAWTGSWCGAAAAKIIVPLSDKPSPAEPGQVPAPYGDLVIPLRGPMLPCQGTSTSALVAGVPGDPGAAVLPPPAAFAALQLTLTLPASTDGSTLGDAKLTLGNPTDTAIALSPCPDYATRVGSLDARGSWDAGGSERLPCGPPIGPHAQATYRLPLKEIDPGLAGRPLRSACRSPWPACPRCPGLSPSAPELRPRGCS